MPPPLYVPLNAHIVAGQFVTVPWRNFFQALNGLLGPGGGSGIPGGSIGDGSVTYEKLQDVSAASRLLGRGDSGAGPVEEIILGAGLTMTGTTLSATGGSEGGYWAPLTDGDPVATELIFADAECVMVFVPVP